MYHKAQSLAQVGMYSQAISLLRRAAKHHEGHEHGHEHEHNKEHASIKNKILKDGYFLPLRDEKTFLAFINTLP